MKKKYAHSSSSSIALIRGNHVESIEEQYRKTSAQIFLIQR